MSENIPSTKTIRDRAIRLDKGRSRQFANEFDRWLDERDDLVAAKALEDLAWDGFEAYLVDPELEWENQPSAAAQHFKSSAEKLRRRASEYRKGGRR